MMECQTLRYNILEAIGNTPMICVEGIYVKLETHNATGSVKDRMVAYMVRKAEERGDLKPGAHIIEVTSGNTGIALSMVAALRGYCFTAIMPEHMSQERIRMMKAYGAQVILTPEEDDMQGACHEYCQQMHKYPEAWLPSQFENSDNFMAHKEGLGQEILRQMKDVGPVDAIVAGIGTGGTLIGTAMAVKEVYPECRIVGVEPAESAVLTKGPIGPHKIEGIGEGFIPQLVQDHMELIDEVIAIPSEDSICMSKSIASKYGALVGVSSGANLLAAREIKKRYENVVTIFPDRGERYLSKWYKCDSCGLESCP